MTPVRFRVLLVAISTAVAAACGGNASMSPTAPSVTRAGASGAVIIGQVSGASAPIATRDASSAIGTRDTSGTFGTLGTLATSSITVKITGTNISTVTDGQGQFTLTGVPPGDVQLEFSGQGTSAKIVISGVSAQDEIRISITLNGNNAHVDSERRNRREDGDKGHDLAGPVASLSGTCPTLAFILQGTRVTTTASTTIAHGNCTDLRNGVQVEATGVRGTDGTLAASRIEIEDRQMDEAEVTGAASGLSGTCPNLTFTVQGTKVTTTANTKFDGITCARVQNGTIVEVEGRRQADGTIAAAKVELV